MALATGPTDEEEEEEEPGVLYKVAVHIVHHIPK